MTFVVYGLQKTRITLHETDGTTPKFRITLQKETKEGLTLTFKPEGQMRQAGSGGGWARSWAHWGFRAQVRILWDLGTDETTLETWTAGAWSAPSVYLTASALALIFTHAFRAPCLVEPHTDKAYSFLAQPDPGKPLELKDIKGVAHSGLELVLIGDTVGEIPDWAAL